MRILEFFRIFSIEKAIRLNNLVCLRLEFKILNPERNVHYIVRYSVVWHCKKNLNYNISSDKKESLINHSLALSLSSPGFPFNAFFPSLSTPGFPFNTISPTLSSPGFSLNIFVPSLPTPGFSFNIFVPSQPTPRFLF